MRHHAIQWIVLSPGAMAEPWLTADTAGLLGFCSKLALMRMPNALEAGPHFLSSNVPFSICWSTPTLPILSNSVYCCSFRVANCAGTAKDIVSQRHRCLPHIEATGWSKLIEVMRHIVSRSEGLQCYQMLPIDNGKHCLFLSQTCLCKTVVGSKSGGLEEVMERRTCFAAMWQDLRQLRPFWRFPSHLPQLFHLALPGHR